MIGKICGPIIKKDPAIRVSVSKETRILLMILNWITPRFVEDILFRLDLFSIRMKMETTIIAAKKMRTVFIVIEINLLDFDRCYQSFR